MLTKIALSSFVILLCITPSIQAQQWEFSNNNTYYNFGKVGIGTTNPQYGLHLLSQGNTGTVSALLHGQYYGAQISTEASGSGYYAFNIVTGTNSTGGNGTSRFFVRADGNIGIGTSNPEEKLEVLGKVRFNAGGSEYGDIYFQNSDVNETGYANVWPDQNERALMIKARGYLDGYGAGGGGIQFFTYDVTGGSWGNFTGGYKRAMVIRKNGNVGIGTAQPTSKLHVDAGALGTNAGDKVNISTYYSYLQSGNNSYIDMYSYRNAQGSDWLSASTRIQQRIDATNMGYIEFNPPGMAWGMALGTDNTSRLMINKDGQVGIGTSSINDNAYALFVEKGIRTRKVKVDQAVWPDHVFHTTYQLRPLSELEGYIQQHHHLPELPSAQEVAKEGLDLGNNQAMLLKKIEELTLYVIEQNKKLEKQNNRIKKLEAALKK